MKPDFVEYLKDHVVLGDGALGSYLYEKGIERGRNLDLLNLQASEFVFSAHEEYIRAGSQLIETNTFGANRFRLREVGAQHRVREINRAGAGIAVKAAGHQVYVAGSVGPTGLTFPLDEGEVREEDIRQAFNEQISALVDGGVDLIILETFPCLDEILPAIKAARAVAPHLPLVAQMVFPARGMTVRGEDALTCGRAMAAAGADIVGTNCGRGIDAMATAVRCLAPLAEEGVILSAFPNAGMPEMVGHRMIYPAQPSYMAMRAGEMVRYGVHLLGGCCGTGPEHIHEFRSTLKIRPVRIPGGRLVIAPDKTPETAVAIRPGGFLAGLQANRLPIIVELDPPTHLDVTSVLAGSRSLTEAGVDAISLGDNPLATLRVGNLGVASLMRKETGIQTIIHQSGRDLNALALQARMMEAHLLGIEAVLAVSGDSASATDQPEVSGVFDLRSYGLLRMLRQLNGGLNMAGRSIKHKTNFSVGAAFSFRPDNPKLQISRLEKKFELGARFAMTQPLFSRESVERMMEETSHLEMLIFPGIFPIISARNAEFLHNEVPGMSVPGEFRRQLASYPEVADQRQAALDYTRQLVEDIAPTVDGFYFVSPLNKWDIALEFVRQVRQAGWQGSGRASRFCKAQISA